MKKQKMQLFILLAALLIAVGGYFGLKYLNGRTSDSQAATSDVTVLALSVDDITGFSYDYEGTTYSFVKDGDNWLYEGDQTLDLDESQVSSLLGNVVNISSEQEITDVEDLKQYGLASPQRTVTLETADTSYSLQFGDYNSIISKYYLKLDGGETVYTTSGYHYTSFDTTPEELAVVEENDAVEESDVTVESVTEE